MRRPSSYAFAERHYNMKKTSFQSFPPTSTWTSPPAVLDLESHQVDIWRAPLELSADSLQALEATLSADEIQRADRFQGDKNRFIAAHGCLRDILARYQHCEPAQLSFSANDHGKPALAKDSSEPKVAFNLSHSDDFALVAVTWERKVGVDWNVSVRASLHRSLPGNISRV
jgi:4'-phosphopantetheinyl transferase